MKKSYLRPTPWGVERVWRRRDGGLSRLFIGWELVCAAGIFIGLILALVRRMA